MALEGADVAALLVNTHWVGMLLGLGTAAIADMLGLRVLLSVQPGPGRRVFTALHVAIGLAILTLLFSGTGLIVLRADKWCEATANILRIGPACLPYKLATKLVLMLTLVGVALLIDLYLLPLSRRRERPLIMHLSRPQLVRIAMIGSASLTCWLSLAAIPFFKQLHSFPPLELLSWCLTAWASTAAMFSIGLLAARELLARSADEHEDDDELEPAYASATNVLRLSELAFGGARAARTADRPSPELVRAPVRPPVVHASPLRLARARQESTGSSPVPPPTSVEAAFASSWRTVLGVLGVSFVINALMLTGPLYMLQVYDRVLTSRSTETLTVLTILVVGLFAVMGLLDRIRARILSRIAVRLDGVLAAPLLASAIRVAPVKPKQGPQAPLRDLDQIRQFVSGPAPAAMLDLPWAPVYFAIVFLLHPLLGVVALAGAAFLVALSILNQMMTRKALAQSAEGSARCDAYLESGRRGAETLSALGMTGAFRSRWLEEHTRALSLQLRANDVAGSIAAATRVSRMLLQSLLLGLGAWLALHDSVSPGAMIAASIIAARALAPIEQIVANWRGIGSVRGALQRCKSYLASLPDAGAGQELPAPRGELVVSNLFVSALGESEPVLKGLNFRLEPGDALAVLGASGAGKSTLARALVGVWPCRHGDVRLDGAALAQWNTAQLGRHIGYLPQDVALFDGTVAENIARLDPEPDPQAVLAAAHAAGVHEMILRLPQGYATRVGEAGAAMPGGQRQRIALARALYGDPALIVMAEPNANLDAAGETALCDAILRLRRMGRTIVVIAHRRSVLAAVNRVLVLRDGRQAAFGPPETIISADPTRKAEAIDDAKSRARVVARTR